MKAFKTQLTLLALTLALPMATLAAPNCLKIYKNAVAVEDTETSIDEILKEELKTVSPEYAHESAKLERLPFNELLDYSKYLARDIGHSNIKTKDVEKLELAIAVLINRLSSQYKPNFDKKDVEIFLKEFGHLNIEATRRSSGKDIYPNFRQDYLRLIRLAELSPENHPSRLMRRLLVGRGEDRVSFMRDFLNTLFQIDIKPSDRANQMMHFLTAYGKDFFANPEVLDLTKLKSEEHREVRWALRQNINLLYGKEQRLKAVSRDEKAAGRDKEIYILFLGDTRGPTGELKAKKGKTVFIQDSRRIRKFKIISDDSVIKVNGKNMIGYELFSESSGAHRYVLTMNEGKMKLHLIRWGAVSVTYK